VANDHEGFLEEIFLSGFEGSWVAILRTVFLVIEETLVFCLVEKKQDHLVVSWLAAQNPWTLCQPLNRSQKILFSFCF
jgi:hypothetical protein